jgi:hypothetical protein
VSSDRFPARPLLTLTAESMNRNRLCHNGPMGVRTVMASTGGAFEGDTLRGHVAPGLATGWMLRSAADPDVAVVEGLITLRTSGGATVLMKYLGRQSAFYADEWRIGVLFEADGEADWLNDVVAAGRVEARGDDLCFILHELLGRSSPPDAHALAVQPLYTMAASGSVGQRYKIDAPIGGRYLSVAESGCRTQGRLAADWPAGFSWGAHRTAPPSKGPLALPFHIDLKVAMTDADDNLILQHYIGANRRDMLSTAPDVDQSWRTVATFEAPLDGPQTYLNQVVALGFGWVENNEACYDYRVML